MVVGGGYVGHRRRPPARAALRADGSLREAAGPCFALSPRDLCTVECLGPLAEAGVAALKIEGRMKAPDSVAVGTAIYRKYLDLYAKYGQYRVDPADLKDLRQIFSRGDFTQGYLFGNPGEKLMSRELSKHQGVLIGKVTGAGPGKPAVNSNDWKPAVSKSGDKLRNRDGKTAAGNRQRGLVTVQLSDRLSVGDGIEIRTAGLPGNLVTFMLRNGKKVDSAGKGELATVGYIDGAALPGDRIYKISDKALMERARASYEVKSGSAEKARRKTDVSFHFSAGLDRPISLTATAEDNAGVTKTLAEAAEKALTKALTREAVEAQLGKTGGTPFRMAGCTVDIEEGISVPLSRINELRRAALEELEVLKRQSGRVPVRISPGLIERRRQAFISTDAYGFGLRQMNYQNPKPFVQRFKCRASIRLRRIAHGHSNRTSRFEISEKTSSGPAESLNMKVNPPAENLRPDRDPQAGNLSVDSRQEELFLYLYRADQEALADPVFSRVYVPYDAMLDGFCRDDARAVPVIPAITKGWHDSHIRKNFDRITAMARSGVAVGNLGWIGPFAAAGVNVIGDFGLNLFNSMDFLLVKRLGVREAVISHESEPEDILKMDFHGVIPEAVFKGRIPVMTSEHCFIGDPVHGGGAGRYFLKDRKGQFYPVLTDPAGGRSMILSGRETDLSGWKEALKREGIHRFRVYAE